MTIEEIAAAWKTSAGELAAWAFARMVNRTDGWGAYRALDDRPPEKGKSYTAKGKLTEGILVRHFAALRPQDVIGLHAIGQDNLSRWFLIDVDQHEESAPGEAAALNLTAAGHWLAKLTAAGWSALLMDSNGNGGFHLLAVLEAAAASAKVHAFVKGLVADYAELGFSKPPETFPKQAEVMPDKPWGNWQRLPGRHHTREHWTRIWDQAGGKWLSGAEAVAALLGVKLNPVSLLPEIAEPAPRIEQPKLPPAPREGLKTEPQIAAECLAVLDPDMPYDDWSRVGMALRDGGRKKGCEAEMFLLWEQWSQRGAKFKPGECERKWKTFGGSGVGMGTLVEMARSAGARIMEKAPPEPEVIGTALDRIVPAATAAAALVSADPVVVDARRVNEQPPKQDAAESKEEPTVFDPKSPLPIAKFYRRRFFDHPESPTLHHADDVFYAWNVKAAKYEAVEVAQLRSQLYSFLETCKKYSSKSGALVWFDPNRAVVDNVLDALKAECYTRSTLPAWLMEDATLPDPLSLLVARNGMVRLTSSGRPEQIRKPTPLFFSINALDYDYLPAAPSPQRWIQFLDDLFPEDNQSIELLQEFFGYCLTPDTRHHKILLAVGPPRSGKGTIGRILAKVIGEDNVCGPTLGGLATNFGLWPLVGKTLAIISDARLSGRTDQAAVVERLLAISGEDAITIDRKNLQPVTLRLPTRFMILTNELPRLNDNSGALANRFIVLTLEKSYLGREDTTLTNQLLSELPGILLWAVEGWKRLQQRGRFVQPDASADSIEEMKDLASPISAFVRDWCVMSSGSECLPQDLFEAWGLWCKEQGRDHSGTLQVFGRDLRAAEPLVSIKAVRDGNRVFRMYIGIGLSLTARSLVALLREKRATQSHSRATGGLL